MTLRETDPAKRNIGTIAEIEEAFLKQRATGEKFGDRVARFSGSMTFFALNVIWYALWIVLNVGLIPGVPPFDPYPFTFLTLMVSLEAIFLAIFVLASQNRFSRQSEQRAHLNLQIDLLAEQESTKTLQMLTAVCQHLGLESPSRDTQAKELARNTSPEALVDNLRTRLPNQ